jgi:hypothetical protein
MKFETIGDVLNFDLCDLEKEVKLETLHVMYPVIRSGGKNAVERTWQGTIGL